MNILFVLYGDLYSNSASHLALYARELQSLGHKCAVTIPDNLESKNQYDNAWFSVFLFDEVLDNPSVIFADGRPADVVHAWTPREVVREFIILYLAMVPTPWVIYLEDNEYWISCHELGVDERNLFQQTDLHVSRRITNSFSHPFRYHSFIGLADVAVVIQEKLAIEVPPWVHCETVMPCVDLEFFAPRKVDPLLREKYGIKQNEKIIVYPGGMNGFTKPLIKSLCEAVHLINNKGFPCKLLRTGPFKLDFTKTLPKGSADKILDLGLLPREELPNLLSLADVLVQPGKVDPFEDLRLPCKLPEFLAMGRPVVMPSANIANLLIDGVDVVLTETGSAEEIAEKCIAIFSNPEQAEMMAKSGRRFAEMHFDAKSQALKLENAYKIACHNFNPMIAKKIWGGKGGELPVDLSLALRLKFLAGMKDSGISYNIKELLGDYSRYIEHSHRRISGLEAYVEKNRSFLYIIFNNLGYVAYRYLRKIKKKLIGNASFGVNK